MKKLSGKIVSVFFYCNFFIAGCAASLVYSTIYLLGLSPKPHWFAALVFCCTMNIYTFHYYRKSLKTEDDHRLNWYRRYKYVIWSLLVGGTVTIAALITKHFDILFGKQNLLWTLVIPLLSLGYSFPFLPGGKALRHFGWLKLPLLSVVWSFTTIWLPVFYSGNSFHLSQVILLFIDSLFFIMALCMLFNVRDYEEDKMDKVITPAVALGPSVILQKGKWLICGINTITGILLARAFHFSGLVQYAAVLLPVVLVFILFRYFRFNRSEMQFVYLHDGLMPVKALLLIFAALSNVQ